MADEQVADNSVEGAAAAIEALFSKPAEAIAQPEHDVIQSQPEPVQAAPASEANASEEVQAPASEVPATEAPPVEAKTPAPISPELEQREREANTKAQEATAARDQFLNALNVLVPQMEASIKGEFADIKTQDDLFALGDPRSPNYNPDRYNAAVIAFGKLNQARQAQGNAQAQAAQEQRAVFEKWQQGEMKKLGELLPELKDQTKGPALAKRIQDYALSTGRTPQQLAMASAQDFRDLHDAMAYRSLEAARTEAAKKAAKAPTVQQPGNVRETNKNDQVQESFTRLQKTGRLDDAAAVMRNFL